MCPRGRSLSDCASQCTLCVFGCAVVFYIQPCLSTHTICIVYILPMPSPCNCEYTPGLTECVCSKSISMKVYPTHASHVNPKYTPHVSKCNCASHVIYSVCACEGMRRGHGQTARLNQFSPPPFVFNSITLQHLGQSAPKQVKGPGFRFHLCHFLNVVALGALPKRFSHHSIYPSGLTTKSSSSQELKREMEQRSGTNPETFGQVLVST